ncbi:hypothetical protein HRI_001725000 [Hibiscus trionum]|uniref:Uncharacterized protein n=1 Tax=Hibiscus trionum TaxID=183268 RepID=A0A9W7HNE7_HIBTR|nr:hypothetical protein HRI_001725000 [Hibiscus trionum]
MKSPLATSFKAKRKASTTEEIEEVEDESEEVASTREPVPPPVTRKQPPCSRKRIKQTAHQKLIICKDELSETSF